MNPYKRLKLLNYFLLVMLTLLVIFMMLLLAPAWKRIFTEKAVYNKSLSYFKVRFLTTLGMTRCMVNLGGEAEKNGKPFFSASPSTNNNGTCHSEPGLSGEESVFLPMVGVFSPTIYL